MDDRVAQALQKWPNVPHVYGYVSLCEQGCWRLHPDGQAMSLPHQAGLAIEKSTIVHFFNRHYMADEQGQWFIQNGPQRVYVRLDAAPYILRTGTEPHLIYTHNQLLVEQIHAWYVDSKGRLYASTNLGAGLVQGRDVAALLTQLHTPTGLLEDYLLNGPPYPEAGPTIFTQHYTHAAPLFFYTDDSVLLEKLAFIACPQAS